MNKLSKFKINNLHKLVSAYTLIELMVVMLIFSILSVVVVQSLSHSLRSSRKSGNISEVRENVEYAMNTMERLLRNARGIDTINSTPTDLWYIDEYNTSPSPRFSCLGGNVGYIASGSASIRLTSTGVYIDCTAGDVFRFPTPEPGVPPSIEINIVGRDAGSYGAETSTVTSTTKLLLRTY